MSEKEKNFDERLADLESLVAHMDENLPSIPQLLVRKLREDARLPEFATDGSACFDFFSPVDVGVDGHGAHIATGLSFSIPEGWSMLIFSRSGHGFNRGVRLVNCVGVIDSDYRDEVMVGLVCDRDGGSYQVKTGDKIAQGMLVPVHYADMVEVSELPEVTGDNRRTGGLGSTGS